jgi:hypothetical protein
MDFKHKTSTPVHISDLGLVFMGIFLCFNLHVANLALFKAIFHTAQPIICSSSMTLCQCVHGVTVHFLCAECENWFCRSHSEITSGCGVGNNAYNKQESYNYSNCDC